MKNDPTKFFSHVKDTKKPVSQVAVGGTKTRIKSLYVLIIMFTAYFQAPVPVRPSKNHAPCYSSKFYLVCWRAFPSTKLRN